MRRVLVIFSFLLAACQAFGPLPLAALARPASASLPLAPQALVSRSSSDLPDSADQLPKPEFEVRFHPDGSLYVGDRVSIEVVASGAANLQDEQVAIEVSTPSSRSLGTARFYAYGLGGRQQATFQWAWDTSGLSPGDYTLTFTTLPDRDSWTETVSLYPEWLVPRPEPDAHWASAESECCVVHYITGTDAEEDLPILLKEADIQAADAVSQMGIEFDKPITITLLPRVLGHGGFAADDIYISYLDDNYAGNDFTRVLHHEMIHILDGRLGGELRPSLLVEGLAVYLSGGHFKAEPILPRAAALFDLGWYIPLGTLADTFYTSQHEVGYLEGAALVQYLVQTYGWDGFASFYRDIRPQESKKQSDALNAAARAHFGLTLEQLEANFIAAMHGQPESPEMEKDVRLSVEFYEAVRRYQKLLDPSAYFLSAWLPDGDEMRQRGIVADYLRRPPGAENRSIENMLVDADLLLRRGEYSQVEQDIRKINTRLYRVEWKGVLIIPLIWRHWLFRISEING